MPKKQRPGGLILAFALVAAAHRPAARMDAARLRLPEDRSVILSAANGQPLGSAAEIDFIRP